MWVPNLPVAIACGVTATAGAVCVFKDFYSGAPYDRNVRADGKTVIITGANSGIGEAAAWEFAKRGAKVFMACRDMVKCEAARREIVLETHNKYVYCRPCDLASLQSVREFVDRFVQEEPYLHVLVNNAGIREPPPSSRLTADGFERQLGVNHLGHFLLTTLLLDTLKKSAPSRVVVVSSSAHFKGKINKEDLNMTKNYDGTAAFNQSKLANVLFTRDLGRRLLESPVAAVCVDPGLTDTRLSRHTAAARSVSRFLLYPLFWPFMKTPKLGAQVILHAALHPSLQATKGDYYVDMKKVEPSKDAQDYELALWLWKVSEKWTRLDQHKAALAKPIAA